MGTETELCLRPVSPSALSETVSDTFLLYPKELWDVERLLSANLGGLSNVDVRMHSLTYYRYSFAQSFMLCQIGLSTVKKFV